MADRLTIAERRARLGRDALYAAREAAELLPGKTADNLAAENRDHEGTPNGVST